MFFFAMEFLYLVIFHLSTGNNGGFIKHRIGGAYYGPRKGTNDDVKWPDGRVFVKRVRQWCSRGGRVGEGG